MKKTSTRTALRWMAMLGAAVTAAALAVPMAGEPAPARAAEDTGSRFSVAVLPDTQFYSRYSADQFFPRYGTDPFEVQTKWIAEHADELNIAFTTHVGDVVDRQGQSQEWVAAGRAMRVLEDAGEPYSILPGNHDVSDMGARSGEWMAPNYLATFPASRLAQNDTFVDAYQNGYSSAHVFEAEGQEFLVLAIGWNASPDTWEWAQSVLDAHKTLPTILTSHAIIDIDKNSGEAADFWFGQEMWEELIRHNNQIFVTLNGHFHGQTQRVLVNDAGNEVYQILSDWQMAADGGNGMMNVLEFDLEHDRIDFATVSPWIPLKHEETLTAGDYPVATDPGSDFSIDIDFSERFSFAEGFGPGDGEYPDLSERAKQIVLDGWEGGDGGGAMQAAGSRDDFVEVPGTVAHWRFGDQAEGVLPENAEITDETGDNPMYRLPVDQINAPADVEDVTITHDNVSGFSADAGAVCFADASRNTGKLNYLTTEYEVPVTHEDFADGYTIESFVFLSDEWTVEENQWGGWLSRTGRRSALPVAWQQYDYEMGPAFFSVSNLKEFQWATTNGTPWTNPNSLWSGEIMTGTWYHVAAVNDPAANTTIMYVDGVPVLRNATDLNGMTFAPGYPWVLGTVFDHDEASNGWNGCVGETRIVDRPLDSSQFLFNRLDIDGDFAAELPEGELAAGTVVSELSGTGVPGTQVRVEREADKAASNAPAGVMAVGLAAAVTQAAPAESATVTEDGTWRIRLAEPISAAGTHSLSVVPSIGTRDGDPLTTSFTIAAAAGGGAGGAQPGGADGAGTGDGSDAGDPGPGGTSGADAAEPDADGLATTGLGMGVWLVLLAGLVVGGAGMLLVRARRRT